MSEVGRVSPTEVAEPSGPGTFGVYLAGSWHRVQLHPETIPAADPIGSLDVSLLQDLVLAPILGVGDPRTDKRIEFVGGIRGTAELERRVDSGEMAIAFSLFPTTVDQLMAVSDAGADHAAEEHVVRAQAAEWPLCAYVLDQSRVASRQSAEYR